MPILLGILLTMAVETGVAVTAINSNQAYSSPPAITQTTAPSGYLADGVYHLGK